MRRTLLIAALIVAVAAFALAGCGRTLMPTPALYYDESIDPFADVPEQRRSNVVEILYITDRRPEDEDGPSAAYGPLRSASLAFGKARVRIGPDGLSWDELTAACRGRKRSKNLRVDYLDAEEQVRLPAWPWYINVADDPDATEEEIEAEEARGIGQIHATIAQELAETDAKEAYVFVHGFNNTFEYAAETLAELWHMTGRKGVAILYSWPAARAGIFGYDADRESSEYTVSHLKQFLQMLATCDAVEHVHVMSHSRGTDVLATAVRELGIHYNALEGDATVAMKLRNVVFAAADIDMEVATQRLGGEMVINMADRLTIYTGASDKALEMAARFFRSEKRVGQVGPDAVVEYQSVVMRLYEDRYSVIYNPRKTGFFGHSYFLNDPAVSSDLILLLRDNRHAGAAHGRPLTPDPTGMWIVPKGYPNNETIESGVIE